MCVYVCMCVCMYVRTYVRMYVCMYVSLHYSEDDNTSRIKNQDNYLTILFNLSRYKGAYTSTMYRWL